MIAPSGVYLTGVVAGLTLALYAIGVVLVHRTHGFLNIAAVEIGALAATFFAILVQGQTLFRWGETVCPPCFEAPGPAARALNTFVALGLSLALAGLVGWLLHAGVARRFRGAAAIVPTVATVFVVQVLAGIGGALPTFLLTQDQRERDIIRGGFALPGDRAWSIGGAVFRVADAAIVVVGVVAAVGLWWLFNGRGRGVSLRAASENPDRAPTAGIDVDRIGARVWVGAAVLSGAAATLTATKVGADAVASGLSVETLVRILAVALAARFTSIPLAAAAAVGVGVVDAWVAYEFGTTLPIDGAMVLVVTALLAARRGRPTTRAGVDHGWDATRELQPIPARLRSLPTVRKLRRAGVVSAGLAIVAMPWLLTSSQTATATVAGGYAIVGLSVLVLTGWAGAVSLGQFAFAAIAAWAVAALRLPFVVAMPAGALVGAAAAALVGFPALRFRGLQLAVSTLALGLAVSAVLLNPRYLGGVLPGSLERPRLLGLDLDDPRVAWYAGVLLVAAAAAAVAGIRRSRTARVLIAARDNERFVQSLGVNVVRARLVAFALSGGFAGVAGVWVSTLTSGVSGDTFAPDRSITLFVFAVIGGLGSVAGPLLGFAAFAVLTVFSSNATITALASGAGGLALLFALPGGLVAGAGQVRDAIVGRAARRFRLQQVGIAGDAEPVPIAAARRPGVADGTYSLAGQWSVPDAN